MELPSKPPQVLNCMWHPHLCLGLSHRITETRSGKLACPFSTQDTAVAHCTSSNGFYPPSQLYFSASAHGQYNCHQCNQPVPGCTGHSRGNCPLHIMLPGLTSLVLLNSAALVPHCGCLQSLVSSQDWVAPERWSVLIYLHVLVASDSGS